ncbi:uncharacterized protein LOC131666375 [Phymastichus coffea]|uniref:uncharacterized protein LOC131666375 n=1 Tax=Phymastichus coffea TaxID=108790 RepID=UPI00273AB780|nr:uncharacterized protein LOC131666375 [Phymastichus coffea]
MSRAIGFGALILCTSTFLRASCDLQKAVIKRNLVISTANSSTVPLNGQLYTVSKNQSHIHINSTGSNYQACDIAIDATRDVTQGRLQVAATEDEIFIVGVKSICGDDQYKYTILRLDPTTCSYQSASIPEINDNRGGYFFPRIVRHRTGTDVFFPSLKSCAPCRLDSAGLRTQGSTPQIPRETTSPGIPFHVNYLNSLDAYFYAYNSHNFSASIESTTLKLLDGKDFSIKKERLIDFPVHAVSKQKKSIQLLGVCIKKYDDFMADISAFTEVRCDRLSCNLDATNTVRIPIEPHSQPISSISYEFDKKGRSIIGFAENNRLRAYIHDKDGKLVKAIDAGEIDGRFEQYPDYEPTEFDAYDYWDVKGFLLDDEYCIVIEQVTTSYSTPLHQVKCFTYL